MKELKKKKRETNLSYNIQRVNSYVDVEFSHQICKNYWKLKQQTLKQQNSSGNQADNNQIKANQ